MFVLRPALELFDLVENVEAYPDFLPWCCGSEVLERSETETVATLRINYHGVRAHFTTRNEKVTPLSIHMHLVEGPFRNLDGEWRFTQLGTEGCKVELILHYEFASRLLEKVLGSVFGHIANTFVEAFLKRSAGEEVKEKPWKKA